MNPKDLYFQMLRIRRLEERLIVLWHSQEIRSLMHLSTGQEAVAVGVCSALRRDDSVFSSHRCHAHYLAKGGDMRAMLAELAGKAGGCAAGRSGSMHLLDPEAGMTLSLPIVGANIPFAVGVGLSSKLKGENKVSVAFFGDGAIEEGIFWESLNFASICKLPVIFVCENNLYATHSHILKRQPSRSISRRIKPHIKHTASVDGNDVRAVYFLAKKMVDYARNHQGPCFIEALTYRWHEHWGPGEDWHLGYRSKEEGKKWKERCPIKILRESIIMEGVLEKDLAAMEKVVEKEIDRAVAFAKNSAEPDEKEVMEHAS